MSIRQPFLALVVVGAFALTTDARADTRTWTVRSGEVLSVIAQRFGVSVAELRTWNSLDGDFIREGQELVVAPDHESESEGRPEDEENDGEVPETVRPEAPSGPAYRVQRGDTLSDIAVRFDTTVARIRDLNPDLDPDRIRDGQALFVAPPRPLVTHTVRPGETLSRIASRYRVGVADIVRWNQALDRDVVPIGEELRIFTDVPASYSESIGTTNAGSLVRAAQLDEHPMFWIRNQDRAFGTVETITWLHEGFDAVADAHPNAPRVRVHDISVREGGPLHGHRSHQSGRDVDVTYYQRFCGDRACPMVKVRPENLLVEPQWTLFEKWLRDERIVAIFVDYAFQAPLYEEAKRRGATARELERWFQYPNGPSHPVGAIRHFRAHQNHFHVRFVCPETDDACHR